MSTTVIWFDLYEPKVFDQMVFDQKSFDQMGFDEFDVQFYVYRE
jgi:hypothetical protein